MPQSDTKDKNAQAVVHCAITVNVRAGREAEFEEALTRFVQRSLSHAGATGVLLIHPAPGTQSREYGILRSFLSEQHRHDFYNSDMFTQYKTETADMVEGDAVIRPLHGLEAFFRGHSTAPTRWKMAIVTWLGVFPSVLVWSSILSPLSTWLHSVAATAVVTICVVVTLTWIVMPALTKLLRPLLYGSSTNTAQGQLK